MRPPCWPDGQSCPNWCAAERYERLVHNRHELPAPWQGWRFAGRDLVSPDGDRISPERLKGLAWRVSMEARRDSARQRNANRKASASGLVTVLRVRNSDWHAERFGCSAG